MYFTKDKLLEVNLSESIVTSSISRNKEKSNFDIFLSHSYDDKKYIFKLKNIIEKYGYSVYVDWLVDGNLDRNNVTPETANILRKRMKQSKCLLFATSKNSSDSKWMPWELGYFDGFKGNVGIIPIVEYSFSDFKGQEYLGLYTLLKEEDDLISFLRSKTRVGV